MPSFDDETEGRRMLLEGILSGIVAGQVERAEAAGQQALLRSSDLPIDIQGLPKNLSIGERRAMVAEATGIRFGEDMNRLFVRVEMPAGWTKVAEVSAYWTNVLDEKGRVRASIFYKAAHYDRRAHVRFLPFITNTVWVCDPRTGILLADDGLAEWGRRRVVDAEGTVLWQSEPYLWKSSRLGEESFAASDDWLMGNGYQDWKNPFAHWHQK